MLLTMNREVFITCAITGSGGSQNRSLHVPRLPKQIADSTIDAVKAGRWWRIVICTLSRDLAYYGEVTDRIREAEVDVVLNLTAVMGGNIMFRSAEKPFPTAVGTDMVGASERVAHIAECLPEVCTLDCGTMNFAEAN